MQVRFVSPAGVELCDVTELPALLARTDGLVWVDLPVWDEEAEQTLRTTFRFHPLAVWDSANRNPVTRIGDALVGCCDAWGHIAADVATGSRTEIGELAEGHGGGSSTMPHKNNPIRSVLIRRAALTAGPLSATLHTASAASVDERSDGAWHAEWATLRTLARRTVVAAAHATELLTGLRVDTERAAANLAAAPGVLSEQQAMTELTGRTPIPGYTGAADQLIDSVLQRARHYLKDTP